MFSIFKKFIRRALPAILMLTIVLVAVAGPIFYNVAHASDFSITGIAAGAITTLLNWLAQTIFFIISKLLYLAGLILDLAIAQTIVSFASLTSSTSMVGVGWTIIRDLSNLVFIFLILWVAISTILRLGSGEVMKSVLRIVIAALLINFSLFITKAVIDVANIFALHFYNLITNGGTGTFSGVLVQGMYIQTLFDTKSGGFGTLSGAATDLKVMLSYVFGSIAALVAIWCFLAAAVMFVIRAIYLIVLMVLSPFAFIAWVVPGMAKYTSDWWHRLFSQAFFAPIFMVMIYIVGKAVQGGGAFGMDANKAAAQGGFSSLTTSLASGVAVDPSATSIVLNFILVIGMLVATLIVSQKLGVAGATTAINWGRKIQGVGQSWVAGRTIGMAARGLDERLGKTYFGNTAMGKKLREWTTIPLKESKWGGKLSAEERHKEDLKLASKRKEAAEVQGKEVGVPGAKAVSWVARKVGLGEMAAVKKMESWIDEQRNVEAIVDRIETLKKSGAESAAFQKAAVEEARKKAKANPTDDKAQQALKDAEANEKTAKQKVNDELEKQRDELQKILVRLAPHSFAEMMPKKLLFTPELMRNASHAQMMAVLGSDQFAEIEKDKVRAARYGHIKDASKKVKEANKDYSAKYDNYIKRSQRFKAAALAITGDDTLFNKMGYNNSEKQLASKEVVGSLNPLDLTMFKLAYKKATSQEKKDKILNEFLDNNAQKMGIEEPARKMIGDVASDVRAWIRAMDKREIDEMYKYDPQMVADRDVTTAIRSNAIVYARESENIASKDKDSFRDAKLSFIIDAEDLVNGIGELAPSFDTFQHMLDSMIAAGAKDVAALQKMIPRTNPDAYKKYEGSSPESLANWERLKEDFLRPATKKIALDEGNRWQYLDSFNSEQKAMATLGAKKMLGAIGGQSNDEFPLLRGVRWRNPAFVEYIDRGIATEFRTKDISDIKEVMDMVLFRAKDYLADSAKKISAANMDLLHWVVTEAAGRNFIKRNQINPQLQETFDKMATIFAKIGRGGKPTYENFEQAKAELIKEGKLK
jgi:hypothetical protein